MKKAFWFVSAALVLVLLAGIQACNKNANPAFAVHPCTNTASFGTTSAVSESPVGPCTVIATSYVIPETVDIYQFETGGMIGEFAVGLYTDKSGAPGSLVTTTGIVTGSGAGQTQTIPITPVEVSAGTYWLAFVSQSAVTVGVEVGSGIDIAAGCPVNGGIPPTFSATSGSPGAELSVKADYCH